MNNHKTDTGQKYEFWRRAKKNNLRGHKIANILAWTEDSNMASKNSWKLAYGQFKRVQRGHVFKEPSCKPSHISPLNSLKPWTWQHYNITWKQILPRVDNLLVDSSASQLHPQRPGSHQWNRWLLKGMPEKNYLEISQTHLRYIFHSDCKNTYWV